MTKLIMLGQWGRHSTGERGYAVSVIVLGVFAALMVVAGLVVDGGQQATAASRAETVAAGAARAAVNAGAGGTLRYGGDRTLSDAQARQAALDYIAAASGPDGVITGRVTVAGTRVQVSTEVRVPTIFLSVIGIGELRATGQASARVVPNR